MQRKAHGSIPLFRGTHSSRTLRSSSASSLADAQPSEDSSDAFVAQFVRASSGNKLFDFVDNVQLLARIVNGIALQSGIVESAIPANEAIAELLRMGSLTPDKLKGMNDSDVTAVMDMMKKAPSALVQNTEVTKIEDHYLTLNSVIETNFDSDTFTNLSVPIGNYVSALDKIDVAKVDASITNTINFATKLKNALNDVTIFKSDNSTAEVSRESKQLSTLNDIIVDVERSMKDLPSAFPIGEMRDLQEKSSFVQLLTTEHETRNKQQALSKSMDAEQQSNNNFQFLDKVGALFGQHQEVLDQFISFIETRQSDRQQVVQHSAGLPNGVADLERLPTDIADKWFHSSAHLSEKAARDLRKGVMALDGLIASLRSVESVWKPALDKVDGMQRFIAQLLRIVIQSKSSGTRDTVMKTLDDCQTKHPLIAGPVLIDIIPAIKLIKDLNRNVTRMSDFTIVNQLTDLGVLRAAVDFEGRNTDALRAEVTPTMVAKLKTMSEVPETIKLLNQFVDEAKFVQSVVQSLQPVKNGMTSIGVYYNKTLKTNFIQWSNCLTKTVGKGGELVAGGIRLIRSIREMGSTQEIAEAETFISTILNSKNSIVAALGSLANMKSMVEDEAALFKLMTQNVSRRFGLAVRGLAELRKMAESRNQLAALTGDVSYIQVSATKVKHLLTAEQFQVLTNFAPLQALLNDRFAQIDAVKSSVETLVETDLKSLGTVFQLAANLTAGNVDSEQLKRVVGVLAERDPSIQPKLAALNSSLDALHPLILDLAMFNIGDAPSALGELEMFFVKLVQSVVSSQTTTSGRSVSVAPPPPSQNRLVAPTVFPSTTTLISSTDSSNSSVFIIVFTVTAGICAIVLVGGGIKAWMYYSANDPNPGPYPLLEALFKELSKALILLRQIVDLVEKAAEAVKIRELLAKCYEGVVDAEQQLNDGPAEPNDGEKREEVRRYQAILREVKDELDVVLMELEVSKMTKLTATLTEKSAEIHAAVGDKKRALAMDFRKFIQLNKDQLQERKNDEYRTTRVIKEQMNQLNMSVQALDKEMQGFEENEVARLREIADVKEIMTKEIVKVREDRNCEVGKLTELQEATKNQLDEMLRKQEAILNDIRPHMLDKFTVILSRSDTNTETKKQSIEEYLRIFTIQTSSANQCYQRNDTDLENKQRRRYNGMWRLKDTAVSLKPYNKKDKSSTYIQANTIDMANKIQVIMCQAPLDGTEEEEVDGVTMKKDDTRKQHWMMIDQKKVELSIMLCDFEEGEGEDRKQKCGKYFAAVKGGTMEIDGYNLKTIGEVDVALFKDTNIKVWEVEYTNLDTGTARKHKILCYTEWPDHFIPASVGPVMKIVKYWRGFKGKTIVHCSAGVGRTCSLVSIRKGVEMCADTKDVTLENILGTVRDRRYGAVCDIPHIPFIIVAISRIIIDEYPEIGFVQCLPEWEFYLDQVRDKTNMKSARAIAALKKKEKDRAERAGENGKPRPVNIYREVTREQHEENKRKRQERIAVAKEKWETRRQELEKKAAAAKAK